MKIVANGGKSAMTHAIKLPTVAVRMTALDGLRGLAAAVVIAHHSLLTWPALDNVTLAGADSAQWNIPWILSFTPLHTVWAGSEAVYLFFVLSGFVLTLPVLRANRPSWIAYYPKRLLRLYLPVWASVALAATAAMIVPRIIPSGSSQWLAAHDAPTDVLRDGILLGGVGMLNSPLWSLKWEVLFSLLLPAYVLLACRFRRFWIVGVVGLLMVIGVGTVAESTPLIFMPMFGIGVLMALGQDQLEALSKRMSQLAWLVMVLSAVVLFSAQGTLSLLPGSIVLETVAAIIFTFTFLYWSPAIRFGSTKALQWLGKRSFSIYLVHEPIIVSVAIAARVNDPVLVLLVAVPISLLVGELFYRFVEKPSHRLANFVGNRVTRTSRETSPALQLPVP